MSEIKVNATIILPGRVLEAESPVLKNQEITDEMRQHFNETHYQETVFLGKKERIVVTLKKGRPVSQNIKLSKEAYLYMTSNESKPSGITLKEWKSLSKNKKLKYHLSETAAALGGKLGSFSVLDD